MSPAFPVREVDPVGAGDVFAAAYLVAYHESRDPVYAATWASCAASFAVEAPGVAGIPTREHGSRRGWSRGRNCSDSQGTCLPDPHSQGNPFTPSSAAALSGAYRGAHTTTGVALRYSPPGAAGHSGRTETEARPQV